MKNEHPSVIDLLIETHLGLERQGPGSAEMTIKALNFIENKNHVAAVLDLGCGTGGQTMVLAQHLSGSIIGVDLFPQFVEVLNNTADRLHLSERVSGVVGSMDELSFQREQFDLIWSEGAIDNIGFEKGITYWNQFLKRNGHIAVTSPSWFTDAHPEEVEHFWTDAGSKLDSVETNIAVMQKAGYRFVAAFTLPEYCWTDCYFTPRLAAEEWLLQKYTGSQVMKDYAANDKREVELYTKYKDYYGYVFYIGRKA
jgi:SAM-dependent methyltransferase